jgi:hypothetical protein
MSGDGIIELRHYTAVSGRGDAVLRRLQQQTFPLCDALGMRLVAWGRDGDDPDLLLYALAWNDADEMLAGWKAFAADPRWQKIVAETEADGPLVANIKRTVLSAASR